MTTPTLRPHRNLLGELADELEREGNAAKRKADDLHANAVARGRELDDHEGHLVTYNRAVQDAHANIVGRLRSILIAPLTAIVDPFAFYEEAKERLDAAAWGAGSTPRPLPTSTSARLVTELLDGLPIGGPR